MQAGVLGEHLPVSIGDYHGSGSTRGGLSQVIFIFGGSYAGTVGGSTFASTDAPLNIVANSDDVLAPIPYTVTAGVLRIVEVG